MTTFVQLYVQKQSHVMTMTLGNYGAIEDIISQLQDEYSSF